MREKGAYNTPAALPPYAAKVDDLQQLITACKNNDRTAQQRLYDKYASFIYGIIRRYTSDEGIAEDIQSEAFFRIFKRLDQYRFEGAFEGWMRRVAINVLSDHFRKRRPESGGLSEASEEVPAYYDVSGQSQLAYKELLLLIHQLPDTQRAVFNLFVFEEYGHKEIADLLGIKENNSRWHLNDARRRLKEQIIATNR